MERVLALAPGEKVELGQHDPVGDRHLLHRFGMGVERRHAVDAVDDGDDAFEPAAREKLGLAHDGVQHRRGIGEAGRLDDDAVERLERRPASRRSRRSSIVSMRSPRMVQHRQPDAISTMFSSDRLDEQMVDADLAELVDDDRGIREHRILEQAC